MPDVNRWQDLILYSATTAVAGVAAGLVTWLFQYLKNLFEERQTSLKEALKRAQNTFDEASVLFDQIFYLQRYSVLEVSIRKGVVRAAAFRKKLPEIRKMLNQDKASLEKDLKNTPDPFTTIERQTFYGLDEYETQKGAQADYDEKLWREYMEAYEKLFSNKTRLLSCINASFGVEAEATAKSIFEDLNTNHGIIRGTYYFWNSSIIKYDGKQQNERKEDVIRLLENEIQRNMAILFNTMANDIEVENVGKRKSKEKTQDPSKESIGRNGGSHQEKASLPPASTNTRKEHYEEETVKAEEGYGTMKS